MSWQTDLYVLATTCAVALSLGTAILIWRQRSAPGASYLALAMVGAAEWAGSRVMEAIALDVPSKVMWSKIEYVGVSAATTFLLMFALSFSRNTAWLRPPRLLVLWLLPVLIVLIAWTNEHHGLLWSSLTIAPDTNILIYGHGPAYYLALTIYTLALGLTSGLLIQAALNMARLYRLQVAVVALSLAPPWILAIIYALRPSAVGYMELTPVGFLITCVLLNWSLMRYKMLDLVPVARDALIDGMPDGVLVLDDQYRIVDMNRAAQQLLGLSGRSPVGQLAMAALARHPVLVKYLQATPDFRAEILLDADSRICLDLRVTAMPGHQGRSSGRLVVLRDITELVRMREELRALSLTDELTGLHNRRGFLTLGRQELRLAERLATSVCLVMADMDGLKLINDRFGHQEGDRALREVARILREHCRDSDVVARLGGDEFAILAVGMPSGNVELLLDRLASAFESLNRTSGLPYSISASLGSVFLKPHSRADLDEMLMQADRHMYEKKRSRGPDR